MEAQGISVTEIRLGLPNTCYYLSWEPADAPRRPAHRRAFMADVRGICRRLDWKIYAAGDGGGTMRLVFETATGNLETGLAALLRDARQHKVYMVQPVAALPFIARYVHESRDAERQPAPRHATAGSAELPDIHFGLFMGERPWATRMLDLLTRCAMDDADPPHRFRSLAELSGSHSSPRDAITEAYRCGRFSLKDIAEHFDMHFSEVSEIINTASTQQRGFDTT